MVIVVIAKHMREAMLEGYEVNYEEVKKLKADRILELQWDCLDENEFLYLYKKMALHVQQLDCRRIH